MKFLSKPQKPPELNLKGLLFFKNRASPLFTIYDYLTSEK